VKYGDIMRPEILWLILGLIIVGVVIGVIVSRTKSSRASRHRIHGITCPRCGSSNIYWAGYSDRKECGKCGHIFS
jgi:ribosomal protein S27AE